MGVSGHEKWGGGGGGGGGGYGPPDPPGATPMYCSKNIVGSAFCKDASVNSIVVVVSNIKADCQRYDASASTFIQGHLTPKQFV